MAFKSQELWKLRNFTFVKLWNGFRFIAWNVLTVKRECNWPNNVTLCQESYNWVTQIPAEITHLHCTAGPNQSWPELHLHRSLLKVLQWSSLQCALHDVYHLITVNCVAMFWALLKLCSALVTTGLGQVRAVFAGWTQAGSGAGHCAQLCSVEV